MTRTPRPTEQMPAALVTTMLQPSNLYALRCDGSHELKPSGFTTAAAMLSSENAHSGKNIAA